MGRLAPIKPFPVDTTNLFRLECSMFTTNKEPQMEATAQQYVATMRHHYKAADAFAKFGKLKDAAKALEAAESARIAARNLGAKV